MDPTRRTQGSERGLDDTYVSADGPLRTVGCASPNSGAVSGNEDEFRIIVATRIRPFTRKEVREWRAEQRQHIQARQQQQQAVIARGQLRQPFGPGTDALTDAMEKGGTKGGAAGLLSDEDPSSMDPEPVMDVENDGTTVVLLDPASPGTARGVYTYDYVFSSFAPSVDIMDMLDDGAEKDGQVNGLDGTWAEMENPLRSSNHPNAVPIAFDDEVDLTAEQEAQAEAEQRNIFCALALPLVDAAFQGLNVCIFAYGQTSSGKTYTMLGSKKHRGIMPRLCHEIFRRVETGAFVAARTSSQPPAKSGAKGPRSLRGGGEPQSSTRGAAANVKVRIDVSYMEIYNEQVRDLLKQRPRNAILHYNSRFDKREVDHQEYQTLKVRHHPTHGIYVEGLTTVTVHSWQECSDLLRAGSQLRTQGSTEMNENSSRSHAIFQLVVTQTEDTGGKVRGKAVANTRISKVNLVDLAGSERNVSSQATGKHLAEANSINVSLSTLRRVIDGLVRRKKGQVIPYRESLLTYVLSDNFGGNSRTVMCANVSPSAANVSETESTLRYATMARAVRNRVKINENPQARVIRELKDRMRVLQSELAQAPSKSRVEELELGIYETEQALQDVQRRERELKRDLEEREAQEARLRHALDETVKQGDAWRREAAHAKKEREKLRQLLQRLASSKPDLLETSVGEELFAATSSEGLPLDLICDDGSDDDSTAALAGPTKPSRGAVVAAAAGRSGGGAGGPQKRKASIANATARRGRGNSIRAGAADTRRRSSAVYGTSTSGATPPGPHTGTKKKKKKKAVNGENTTTSTLVSHDVAPEGLPGTVRSAAVDDAEDEARATTALSMSPPSHLKDAYRQGQPPLSPSGRRTSTSEPSSGRYPASTSTAAGTYLRNGGRAPTKASAGTRLPPLQKNANEKGDGDDEDEEIDGRDSNYHQVVRSVDDTRPTTVEDLLGASPPPAPPSHPSKAPTRGALARADAWEKQLAGLKANRLKKGTPLSLLGTGATATHATPASAPSKVEQSLFLSSDEKSALSVPPEAASSSPGSVPAPVRASSGLVQIPKTYEAHVLLARAPFSGVEDDNDLLWSADTSSIPTVEKSRTPGTAEGPAVVLENELSMMSRGSATPPCFATTRVRVSVEGTARALPLESQGAGSHRASLSLLSPCSASVGSTEMRINSHRASREEKTKMNPSTEAEPSFYRTEAYLNGRASHAVEDGAPRGELSRRASMLPLHDGDPKLSVIGTAAAVLIAPAASTATAGAACGHVRASTSSVGFVPHPPLSAHSHGGGEDGDGASPAHGRASARRSTASSVSGAATHTAAGRQRSSHTTSKNAPPPLSEGALDRSSASALTSMEREIVLSPNNGETASGSPAESPVVSSARATRASGGDDARVVRKHTSASRTSAATAPAKKKAKKKKRAAAEPAHNHVE